MATKVLPKVLIAALIVLLLAAAAVALHFAGAARDRKEHVALDPATTAKPAAKTFYRCSMHPWIVREEPGTCPICHMDLEPVSGEEAAESGPGFEGHATVALSATRRQLIGVQIGTVEKKPVTKTLRAAGRIEYDEKTLATVSLKFGGYVQELMVKSVGESVRKGAPLMSVYSPDLLEAQRNYLAARAAAGSLGKDASADSRSLAEEMARSARERLLLWDFTEEQLKAIEKSQQPEHDVRIFSKVDGVVTARNVTSGGAVEPGKNLFEIADLTTVWVVADVFESEAPLIKAGQQAKVALGFGPGEPQTGVVSYIYPNLDESTRTLRVRLECPNPDGRLKPGMFATVSIAVDLGEQLVVDADAVLDTGTRQIVFVEKGEGRLEPREVTVGERVEGLAVIEKGLKEGEMIVTSGNFLVDSESQMRAALKQAPPPAQSGAAGTSLPAAAGTTEPEKKSGMPGMPGM